MNFCKHCFFFSNSKRVIYDQEHRARVANFGYSSTLRYLSVFLKITKLHLFSFL
jgi:hypothetical protein